MNFSIKSSVLFALHGFLTAANLHAASISDYNVVWDSPSADCHGSMPIGNGDLGANVWVEPSGDICFYLSKTDSWDEHSELLKLGKLRVRLTPNPFTNVTRFKQELNLQDGVIKIAGASHKVAADLRFWIDANHPVVRITGSSTVKTEVEVRFEPWRTVATWDSAVPYPEFTESDTILAGPKASLLWFHRNPTNKPSFWADTLEVQGLADFKSRSADPLLNRTFGALVQGKGLVNKSPTLLKSAQPGTMLDISMVALTAQTATAPEWVQQVEALATADLKLSRETAEAAHKKWWHEFWERSWIRVTGAPGDDTFIVSQGYALQSWITAGAARGQMPIKFNGSIFTVDGMMKGTNMGPDYRRWGGPYWFQNTRLSYYPMLAAGYYDVMPPLFKMYVDALPLAKFRIRTYYSFDGAYFPETMYFWGAYRNGDHGSKRNPEKPDAISSKHIAYHWSNGLELTAMMLEYYQHTRDGEFLRNTLLPFAREIIAFDDHRYPRNAAGKLVIAPANAMEDIWDCENPAPEIAGLRYILPQLAKLTTDSEEKKRYARLLDAIPELPQGKSPEGRDTLLPAATGTERRRNNCEKPECYSIFPFRLYGVGRPGLELARETFLNSPKATNGRARPDCWAQDAIFAACVGNTDFAAQALVNRSKKYNKESRFPAFWGPNFDWTPDVDHGGVNMSALQKMIVQTEADSDNLHLFAAWPRNWDCSFKMHAPGQTIIQGEVRQGKLLDLRVTPASRLKDIVNHL
jgi:hypothetical protein